MIDFDKLEEVLAPSIDAAEKLSRDELGGWDWMDDVGTPCPRMLARAMTVLILEAGVLGARAALEVAAREVSE